MLKVSTFVTMGVMCLRMVMRWWWWGWSARYSHHMVLGDCCSVGMSVRVWVRMGSMERYCC